MEWFVACPKGVEELLVAELKALGSASQRMTVAGVYATGDQAFAYRACLWSRLANRVLLPLARIEVSSADDLYEAARSIAWTDHLTPESSFAVDFSGTDAAIRHTRFGAQKIKDGLVDAMQASCGGRPDVNLKEPDIRLNARLSKGSCVLSLDLSGRSLHRRGYRVAAVPAPLKENLAAALLLRAGWPDMAAQDGALIDPMCGSGTLLIEGAMMAADIAPGLQRQTFGFQRWLQHDVCSWSDIYREAAERRGQGLANGLPEIRGYDKDASAIVAAQHNIAAMQLDQWVRVSAKPVEALRKPTHRPLGRGLLITNPPYGERWGEVETLRSVYSELGRQAKREFAGWRLAVFSGNAELSGELKLRAQKKYQLFNGAIPSRLYLYDLRAAARAEPRAAETLSGGAQMLVNRLRKNQRKLQPWLKREGIECYRLYDSDLPEYAVAIDIYGQSAHVQEYAPPNTVDNSSANRRLSEVKQALQHCFPEFGGRLHFKERRKQKGSSQYQRADRRQKTACQLVREDAAQLEVNLTDYLDTGLFLDHRPIRQAIAQLSMDKRLLNLFCYTGAVTVQAALGGAASSLSIDLSNTYLEWAKRNFALNGIDTERHRLLRADCLQWLESAAGEYSKSFDVIFVDPPTFSNSKMMAGVLDIQRDHSRLIDQAMVLLAPGGAMLFSNNFRRFKMAPEVTRRYRVRDITAETIPVDFARNPKIHNCWKITHG